MIYFIVRGKVKMGEMEQSKKSTVSYGDCVINEYIYK